MTDADRVGSPEHTAHDFLVAQVPGPDHHRELVACQAACPVHTDARGYIRAIAAGRDDEAYLIARGPNPFASICGRICGAPCETACRRGRLWRTDDDGHVFDRELPVAIRALKRFACERHGAEARAPAHLLGALREFTPRDGSGPEEMAALLRAFTRGDFKPASGQRIAIVGGGPAGLAAAHDLALMGFRPVVFEAERVAAGMLALGVPAYRLPREVIRQEVAVIEALGVELRLGVRVGVDVEFAELRRDFAAVVIAVGAKRPRPLGLPGEAGPRVYGGVDLLRAVALGEPVDLGREVVVIGGGNVAYDVARTVVRQAALDSARTALRQPGQRRVRLVSLESLEEMPADTVEIREGDEEGVERINGFGPREILRDADGKPRAVVFRRCRRVWDEARRFAPVFADDDTMEIACDTVLIAAGQSPDLSFLTHGGEDIEELRPGWLRVDPATLASTARGVFVVGDLAHGTRLLIDAVASGKKAARSIYAHLMGVEMSPETMTMHLPLGLYRREQDYERTPRVDLATRSVTERLSGQDRPVEEVLDAAAARREAGRCLDCGVAPVFDGARCVLCGGCVEVCPTNCLALVSLAALAPDEAVDAAVRAALGEAVEPDLHSAIVKDEDLCIRCALCAARCPADAIEMERTRFTTEWRPR